MHETVHKELFHTYVSEWMKFATDTNHRPKTIICKSVCMVWKTWKTFGSNHCTIFYDTPSQEQTKVITIISGKRKVGKNQEKMKRKQGVSGRKKYKTAHHLTAIFTSSVRNWRNARLTSSCMVIQTYKLNSNACNHSPLGMYNPQDTSSHQFHHGMCKHCTRVGWGLEKCDPRHTLIKSQDAMDSLVPMSWI